MADDTFDPGAHTIPEVQEYVIAHPDQTAAVREAEAGGKNRTTLLAWLDEPWPEEEPMEQTTAGSGDQGGTVTDEGGRPVTDEGGRIVTYDGNAPDEPAEPAP